MKILALDPSTDITGLAIVSYQGGEAEVIRVEAFTGCSLEEDSLMARVGRIADTRQKLLQFVGTARAFEWLASGENFIVAYEQHTDRGRLTSEALSQASGAYLTVFLGRPIIPVTTEEAKKAWGGTRYKRAEAKVQVVHWANRRFGLNLAIGQDAIADALAVADAAWARWNEQPSLFGGKR